MTTGDFEKADFGDTMDLAYLCEPAGAVRIYWSHDLQLWFIGAFQSSLAAATVTGSGHTHEQALALLRDSCLRFLANRDAAAAAKKDQEDSPQLRKAKHDNALAREALQTALAAL